MSYLGRRGAASPLTSGDIPADVVQGTDIAYLENDSTTHNLGGTYSTERMYLNDSYTLNDNVTVTGHLALGSIADSDVVITQDSTERTITGSGTLEAGRLMNDFQSSLTGMTGELGSVVTGSPNLNLGNSIFPFGYIIKHHEFTSQYQSYTNTNNAWLTTGNGWSGTTSTNTSKLIVFSRGTGMAYQSTGANLGNGQVALYYHTDSTTKGATPSGSTLGSTTTSGGHTIGLASGRKDLYLSWTLYTTVEVLPNTTYHIQVATYRHTGNYWNMESNTTGYVQEVR